MIARGIQVAKAVAEALEDIDIESGGLTGLQTAEQHVTPIRPRKYRSS